MPASLPALSCKTKSCFVMGCHAIAGATQSVRYGVPFHLFSTRYKGTGTCAPVSVAAIGQYVSCVCRQVVECGYENLWYMRQCVRCDATQGATELTARVSAILQVSSPRMSVVNILCTLNPCRSTCRVVPGVNVSLIGVSQK